MKIIGPEQYRVAYNQYIDLQGECAHWDYETPEGVGFACCDAMNAAKDKVKALCEVGRTTRGD